jgi:outer membrane protein
VWPGDGDPSAATAWDRIAVRRFRISPTRPVEDMKDMRARIRALLAMWAVAGLVIPAPASAQAPQEPSATAPAQPKFAAPQGGTLPLSLDEAVARALENNVDIQVERYNPELAAENVRGAEGYYDPFLFSTLTKSSTDTKGTNAFSGGEAVNTKTGLWDFGVQQQLPTGGVFNVAFNNNKRDTNNTFSTFNPVYNSFLSLNLTQPLLQNFKTNAARTQIKLAKKNREITDVQFRQSVINTIATVKGFYYDLLFAIDNLAANQKNLQLAKKLLEENEIRVKVGTMAPLDVVTAQSEVASREEGVIVAENDLAQAEDDVKRLIFPQNDPLMWSTKIQPTDRATVDPGAESQVDLDTAIKNALQNRTDVVAARKNLENEDYRLALAKSRKLPQLDLIANYGGAGAGGTQLIRDPPLGGPVVDTIPGSYGDAVSEVFGFDFPTWTVGFNVSYAIPNRSAKAAEAQARISKDQTLTSFRRLELQVAAEVRTAGRGVESGFKRVQSTQAARVLAAQRLDAEEKKFAAGMTTNFLVTQAQRDLAQAEVNNLRAVADYRKSVINFQRVQEAGVGGFGAVAILSTGTNNQAGQALLSAAAAGGQ